MREKPAGSQKKHPKFSWELARSTVSRDSIPFDDVIKGAYKKKHPKAFNDVIKEASYKNFPQVLILYEVIHTK